MAKAYREHIVTDQGNGGAYCSECLADLTSDINGKAPYPCPGCGAEYEEGGLYVNMGGSD